MTDLVAALAALALLAVVLFAWRRRGGGRGNWGDLAAGVAAVASLWLLHSPPVIERALEPRSAWLRTPGATADPGTLGAAAESSAAAAARDDDGAAAIQGTQRSGETVDSAGTAPGTTTASSRDGGGSPRVQNERASGERLEAFSLLEAFPTSQSRTIPDVHWLNRHRPEVDRLRVSGHGLTMPEWSAAWSGLDVSDALPWRVEAGPPPELARGFAALAWTRELALGSELTVRGALSACPECVELRLEGAGAGDDAGWRAAPDADGAFELRARPRAAGKYLPELLALDAAGAPLLRQTIDVVVEPPAPLAVLWLERAPSFESRAVRRWREGLEDRERAAEAAGGRGRFVLRSTWSRGRARTAVVGGAAASAAPLRIDQGSLSDFDLVVADAESLRGLPAAEIDALRQAVREQGLGLLLRLGGEERLPPSEPLLAGWRVRALADLDELLARVGWPGFEAGEPLAIGARELQLEWGSTPLVADRAGRVLAAVRYQGAGSVALSLLEGTYRWTLAGDQDAHARLWSRLLQAVARPRAAAWQVPAGPALLDWPLDLAFTGSGPELDLSCREPDGATVALPYATREQQPRRAIARFWPRLEGWHVCAATAAGERVETAFFAHRAAPWSVWLDRRRHDATAAAAELTAGRSPGRGEDAGPAPIRRPVELPRWPFYASFLLAIGVLWAAERWRVAGIDTITDEKGTVP